MIKGVNVKCSSDFKYPGEPKEITIDKKPRKILKVIRRWKEPAKDFFKVEIEDGRKITIYYSIDDLRWFLLDIH